MAHYDYRCSCCGVAWELNVPIADRDKQCTEPCPHCIEVKCSCVKDRDFERFPIERIAAAPGVSYTYGGAKTPESFKDVLRNIKSKHHKSTINV